MLTRGTVLHLAGNRKEGNAQLAEATWVALRAHLDQLASKCALANAGAQAEHADSLPIAQLWLDLATATAGHVPRSVRRDAGARDPRCDRSAAGRAPRRDRDSHQRSRGGEGAVRREQARALGCGESARDDDGPGRCVGRGDAASRARARIARSRGRSRPSRRRADRSRTSALVTTTPAKARRHSPRSSARSRSARRRTGRTARSSSARSTTLPISRCVTASSPPRSPISSARRRSRCAMPGNVESDLSRDRDDLRRGPRSQRQADRSARRVRRGARARARHELAGARHHARGARRTSSSPSTSGPTRRSSRSDRSRPTKRSAAPSICRCGSRSPGSQRHARRSIRKPT